MAIETRPRQGLHVPRRAARSARHLSPHGPRAARPPPRRTSPGSDYFARHRPSARSRASTSPCRTSSSALGKDLQERAARATGRPTCAGSLVDAFAPYLSKPFVDENFKMQSALTGAKELLPRWQRVVEHRGRRARLRHRQALRGARSSRPPPRQRCWTSCTTSARALNDDLATLAWMSPATRKAAHREARP